MGYKDKDKQREANRKAQAKFKSKGITEGITSGVLPSGITDPGIPPGYHAKPKITFADLPFDVQADIEMMSRSHDAAGINDYDSEKAVRTERAIHYQWVFGIRPGTSVRVAE